MKTDTLFYQLMKSAFPLLMEMAGFHDVQNGDYRVEAVEIKQLARRFDGLALPTVAGLPLVAIEYYGQKNNGAYRNIFHKLFSCIEAHKWAGRFVMILIFADRSCAPNDEMFEPWVNTPPFIRVYLNEWLAEQPLEPYTNCLRIMVEKEDVKLDFERFEEVNQLAQQDEKYEILSEIYQNALLSKYNLTFKELIDMLNLTQPFDPTKTKLYKSIKKIGIDERNQEIAQKMIAEGYEDPVIHNLTGLPLKKIQALRKKRS